MLPLPLLLGEIGVLGLKTGFELTEELRKERKERKEVNYLLL